MTTSTTVYGNNYAEVWQEEDGEKLAYSLPDDVAVEHFRNAQETINEVIRQNIKFGSYRTSPDVRPDVEGELTWAELEALAKEAVDQANEDGDLMWSDILLEEIFEAFNSEPGSDHMETELIQVAAVAWSWIEDIRRRRAAV